MNRREWIRKGFFFTTVGGVLLAFGGILVDVLLGAIRFSPSRWTEVAPLRALAGAGIVPFPGKRIAIIRQDDRLAALSLECTHLGCLVNTTGQGFFCPCHGSEFGPLGEVYSGPATRPLKWHQLEVSEESLWVRSGEKLDLPHWMPISPDVPESGKG